MALTVYRFRYQGPAIADLTREVPGNPTFVAASWLLVDLQVDSANLADLQDALASRGWVLDTTSPANTPAQQEAANQPPNFAGVAAALAAANAAIAVNSQRITGLLDPTNAQDAATKAYVDATKQGLDPKDSVRILLTTNDSLSGLAARDGVTPVAGDRVGVVGQTTGSANGIYVAAAGAWTRAPDADSSAKVTAGMYFWVTEGTVNADTGWVLTTNDPIVLGTTSLSFTQFSGAGSIVAGAGLTKSGNTIDVVANADGSIVVNANDIQVGVLASDAQHGNRGGGGIHALAVAAGAAGFMSGADKTKLDNLPATPKTDTLLWGASGIATTTTNRFLYPGGYENAIAPTTAIQYRVPTAGLLRNLRVRAGTAGAGAANLTFTVRKNGVATAITVTGSNTLQDWSDLANTVTVAAGDLIDLVVSKSAVITTSPADLVASLEFAP